MILNGGDPSIQFFCYGFSEYADKFFGRIYMENGLDGKKSDGLKLLVSSLRWLAEPSLGGAGKIGGYAPPEEKEKPFLADPIIWKPAEKAGAMTYQKGTIGIIPAEAGGKGTVAQYVEKARAMGLNFAVFCGEFANLTKPQWDKLCDACDKSSLADFAAIPALITHDDQDNSFLQLYRKSWPEDKCLSPTNRKHVQQHLQYWAFQCDFPMRVPFNFSRGQYPAELHTTYDTFGVRTYEHGQLVDESFSGFLNNQTQGDRSRIAVVDLVRDPAELGKSKEFTFINAPTPAAILESTQHQYYGGGSTSYVSSGPNIINWNVANDSRETYGEDYVPGTERWRASLKVKSQVPLSHVTIYDGETIFAKYALSGHEVDLSFDGLHDNRHLLTAVVEDQQGGRATSGAIEIFDRKMYQELCGDRNNLMHGGMKMPLRGKKGSYKRISATFAAYKIGRLAVATTVPNIWLPGFDGCPTGVKFVMHADLVMTAKGGMSELRRSRASAIAPLSKRERHCA